MTLCTAARSMGAAAALLAATYVSTAYAQVPADSQWRASPLALSTLLQDGYRIVAVVSGTRGGAGPADTIFVQRDQSAFKCIDPEPADPAIKAPAAKAPGTMPACYELVPPSVAAPAADAR